MRASIFLVFLLLYGEIAVAATSARLITPSNKLINVSKDNPYFNWSNILGATKYRIVVSERSDFSDLIDSGSGAVCQPSTCQTKVISDSFYNNFSFKAGTKYYWKVRSNASDWSSAYSFTTVAAAPPPPATLITPSNTLINVPKDKQYFSWSNVSGATKYRIVVSERSNFSDLIDSGDGDKAVCRQSSTCQTKVISDSFYNNFSFKAGTKYYWKVRSNASHWSSAYSFTTVAAAPPPPATLITPSNTLINGNCSPTPLGCNLLI